MHNLKVTSNNIILYYSAVHSINSNSTAAVQLCQAVWAELGEIIEARHGWEATQFDPLRQVTTRFDDASQQQKRSQAQNDSDVVLLAVHKTDVTTLRPQLMRLFNF